jgi:hypothetical protein
MAKEMIGLKINQNEKKKIQNSLLMCEGGPFGFVGLFSLGEEEKKRRAGVRESSSSNCCSSCDLLARRGEVMMMAVVARRAGLSPNYTRFVSRIQKGATRIDEEKDTHKCM